MRAAVLSLGGGGDAAIVRTLSAMRTLVGASLAEPVVRFTAAQIVAGLRNDVEQAGAIRRWMAGHTQFLRDPRGVELLQSPAWLLERGYRQGLIQGDCDDLAMLGAALGMSIGLRARFVAIGRKQFEHVFTELSGPAGLAWVELDTSRPAQGIDSSWFARAGTVEV